MADNDASVVVVGQRPRPRAVFVRIDAPDYAGLALGKPEFTKPELVNTVDGRPLELVTATDNAFSVSLRLPESLSTIGPATTFGTGPTAAPVSASAPVNTSPVPSTLITSATNNPTSFSGTESMQQTMSMQTMSSIQSQATSLMTSASSTQSGGTAQQTAVAAGAGGEVSNNAPTNKAGVAIGATIGVIATIFAVLAIAYLMYQYRKGPIRREARNSYQEMGEEPVVPAPTAPAPTAPANRNSIVSGATLENGMITSVGVPYTRAVPPPSFPAPGGEAAKSSWQPPTAPALVPPMTDNTSYMSQNPTLPSMAEVPPGTEDPHEISNVGPGFTKLNHWLEENRRRSAMG